MIAVADLKDQILTNDRSLLYCDMCGAEFSANAGDYWNLPKTHVFTCCDKPMLLVTKRVVYEEVKI